MSESYKIREAMVSGVFSIESSENVFNAAKNMGGKKIGCLVVIDQGSIVGIITEQDMARKIVAQGLEPKNTLIKDVMSKNVQTVKPDDEIHKAIGIMRASNIKHLPVVSKGKLVGIISTNDIMKRMKADRYLLLSGKKFWMIVGAWIFFVFAHNLITVYFGVEEGIFFLFAAIVVPSYFIVALLYTVLTYFMRERDI